MGTTSADLTVTIITKTGEENLLLEAEIVALDNGGSSTYYVNKTYYLRLHKSLNLVSIISGCTIGSIALISSGLTASVPYSGEDDEYLTFTGEDTATLDKTYNSNFSYTQQGRVYNEDGGETTVSLTPPVSGQKTVIASKKIYGVFKVTYTTKYDKWSFRSSVKSPMVIFFIGSDE